MFVNAAVDFIGVREGGGGAVDWLVAKRAFNNLVRFGARAIDVVIEAFMIPAILAVTEAALKGEEVELFAVLAAAMGAEIMEFDHNKCALSENTAWKEFEANVRRLHSIAASSTLSVTYTDSDGDRIALDTDEEIQDLIRQTRASGKSSVRFEVSAGATRPVSTEDFVLVAQSAAAASSSPAASVVNEPISSSTPSVVESSKPAATPAPAPAPAPTPAVAPAPSVPRKILIEDVPNDEALRPYSFGRQQEAPAATATPVVNADVKTEEECQLPQYESTNASEKGKAPATDPSNNGEGSSKTSGASEKKEEGPNHFEQFAESLEPLLKELQEEFEKSNLAPIFEKIGNEARIHLEPALEELFGQFEQAAQSGEHPHPFFRSHPAFAQHANRWRSHCGGGGARWAGPRGGCGPRSGRCGAGRAAPPFPWGAAPRPDAWGDDQTWPPRWFGVVCDSCDARSFSGARHKCEQCPDFDLCAGCHPSASFVHDASHTFRLVTHPREKALEEAIQRIRETGAVYDQASEEKARALLIKYGGNLDRVVDILLRDL
ncbi:hypothetical protein HDU96_007318 [Phlyctochytrium bullatum]|nr:hypothetical protein HDU96_007318 [Phlyctochytrium bullatum]